jgi:zinc protease
MTSDRNDPLVFARTVRADGLTVVRQPSPPGSAGFAATYVAPAGWAYDPAGREGLAVLTSLLGPSAAGRRDRVALARELDRLGGSFERHCAPESAEVGVNGPASELEPLLTLLADVILRPRFEPDDLGRVRRQIFERQLREATQPGQRAERELLRAVFARGSPYRASGLGNHRSVARIRREEVRRFHRSTSTSDGGFLVVTTSRSFDEVVRLAATMFPEFPSEHPVGFPRVEARKAPVAAERSVEMADRTQTEIRIGGGAPPRSDPAFPALYLANEVLGGRSMLNRLFQHVREQRGLAYHASSDLEAMRWGGYWLAQAGTGPERADAVVQVVTAEVRSIGTRLISPSELDRIRESTIGEIPLALETAGDAHELAVDGAYHGLSERYWREWPHLLRAVSSAAIREAAAPVYDLRHATTIVVGPGNPVALPPPRAV